LNVRSTASLPLLIAKVAEESARDELEDIALDEGTAVVPLITAPRRETTHSLEVYVANSPDILYLLADPAGEPTDEGFPLRLRVPELTSVKRRPEGSAFVGRMLDSGKIEIESRIGGGGLGDVYRAKHHRLGVPVAVKVLLDEIQNNVEYAKRFHAEALAASGLDHPNITRVIDFGEEPDGLLYFVMEYLDGISLRTILERETRLTTDRIGRLISQVCAGLAHAHDRGIIHKDVKPENLVTIMGLDDDGESIEIVKVCDFGIAQGVEDDSRRFAGTPDYMSPEQCRSEILDARSDVYSCGIVLYELATGVVPFADTDVRTIIRGHLHTPPRPPSEIAPVNAKLEGIIMMAIEKDRALRFPNMRALRAALRDLIDKPFPESSQFRRFELPLKKG
jgi:serine/threonine protein kinase